MVVAAGDVALAADDWALAAGNVGDVGDVAIYDEIVVIFSSNENSAML